MAENRREKDKRFFYTRGQLVLLGAAFTVTSIVIFFLGMIVGKGIEARKMVKAEEALVKIPVKPSGQGASEAPGSQAKEEITFYDTLTKTPEAEPPIEAKPKDTKLPEKTAKSEVQASKSAKEEAPVAPAKAAAKAMSPTETSAQTTAVTAESKENDASWTVQVNAYPDERSAKLLVDQLKDKGYNAKVTEVLNKGKTWYRVRVGRYDSKEEAKKVEESLKNKENFSKAFATSK
ncbi:MAG TPA: SPOR domain-containing protein [Methylomirabilota bacterium]|nr:SPOR domain-containing protein [Methylomirabilota bacterium]